MDEIETFDPACDMCGTTHEAKRVRDPYEYELSGRTVLMWLCPSCLRTRYDDI